VSIEDLNLLLGFSQNGIVFYSFVRSVGSVLILLENV